jgi:hypothetical protein
MFYKTDIDAIGYGYFYFANKSDLMDHLQQAFNCTADEIEFSDAWRLGDDSDFGALYTTHDGNVDKAFCDFHNSSYASGISYDVSDLND